MFFIAFWFSTWCKKKLLFTNSWLSYTFFFFFFEKSYQIGFTWNYLRLRQRIIILFIFIWIRIMITKIFFLRRSIFITTIIFWFWPLPKFFRTTFRIIIFSFTYFVFCQYLLNIHIQLIVLWLLIIILIFYNLIFLF